MSDRMGSTRLLECPQGAEYDEETFHYFSTLEQARAARAHQTLFLLLAAIEVVPDRSAVVSAATAARLFAAMRVVLRDTDVIGWYRQGVIAGAVLSVSATVSGAPAAGFGARVEQGLRRRLPLSIASTLRVRIVAYQPGGAHDGRSR